MKFVLKKYFIPLLLAIVGLVIFEKVPPSKKVLQLLPSTSLENLAAFSDNTANGHSVINMVSLDTLISAQMILDTTTGRDAWAGFSWKLVDANWSFMDTAFLEIRCQGCTEVQIKLLTFDPDHSVKGEYTTYRQVVKEIPVTSGWQRIAVPAEHFYIPEWWYLQQKVSRKLDSKHLESVARFDVQPSSQTPRGIPVVLEVRSLTMEGGSPRNAAILLCYLFLLMIFVIGTNPHRRDP